MVFKRTIYISLAVILGFLLSTLLHAGIELPLLHYITEVKDSSPDAFAFGYWHEIHMLFGTTLWVVGSIGGYVLGRRWWRQVYEDTLDQPWLKSRPAPYRSPDRPK